MKAAIAAFSLFSILFSIPNTAMSVGFRVIKQDNNIVGVWYPSDVPVKAGQLGPFDVAYAFDAEPVHGQWPVIIFSHGRGGLFHNHHLTAKALAQAGFIVIAPQHNSAKAGDKITEVLPLRVKELKRAFDVIKIDTKLGPLLDVSRIHAFGYSLGGATVMHAAGTGINLDLIATHCDKYSEEDVNFCSFGPSFPERIMEWLSSLFDSPTSDSSTSIEIADMPNQSSVEPFINGAVAVVGSLGQGLEINAARLAAQKVLVVAIAGDDITPPRFHSEILAAMIPAHRSAGLISVPGHHYAFIAPFPERVTAYEYIPVAQDPEGFDRAAFIDEVNIILTSFFKQNTRKS